ncbi:MAG: tRNA (adenosine(37)-N6)-threonylcarbamoyltransferase complex transferase subunit TsaD, partial [Bdellovibrionales bacterium]|nr:tRNA (adenosine(37)-N6)-threonylcarbamoyltransferase complex transferase subunit TsaD [Bdellovibrionales bacterium]
GICVTSEPGLMGSLIVGVVTAKTLALAWKIPFLGVNHLEGHILAPFLSDKDHSGTKWKPPFLSLAVSGGHSSIYLVKNNFEYRVLGTTKDDAAGEAFDKLAKALRLGFPGGPLVDQLAKEGDREKYKFPRPLVGQKEFDFSFSGLKTFAFNLVNKIPANELKKESPHICASFQESVVDSLLEPLFRAAKIHKVTLISITGGVSANSRLREKAERKCAELKIELSIPPIRYCTDNAAMIGFAGIRRMNNGERSEYKLAPSPRSKWTQS